MVDQAFRKRYPEKGHFVKLRHNFPSFEKTTATLLFEDCKDVNLDWKLSCTNSLIKSRIDIASRGFWSPGRKAFFDVKGFNLRTEDT